MSQYNHFDYVPSTINSNRSIFKFDKPILTNGYLGFLYPLCEPVRMLPGSSLDLDIVGELESASPLVKSFKDPLFCDFYAFSVPNRIVWEHWKQFLGAVDDVLFNNLTQYEIPSLPYGVSGQMYSAYTLGTLVPYDDYIWCQTIACHFGLQNPFLGATGGSTLANCPLINVLPFRGYTFIWNEFFKPEFIQPQVISVTDTGLSGMNIDILPDLNWDAFPSPATKGTLDTVGCGGAILPVFRAHRDLYTSCLPSPSLETLNLLAGLSAPVGIVSASSGTALQNNPGGIISGTNFVVGFNQFKTYSNGDTALASKDVIADLNQAVLTVNNYRETIMLQNYYDTLNRSGSRYDEILANLFHIRTSNAVTQIPEIIVHKRFVIHRQDIIAGATTSQALSGTKNSYIDCVFKDSFFTVSTTEHAFVHMLWCVRPAYIRHSQGIAPMWTQLDKFSQYYQQFDGMGDVKRMSFELVYDWANSYANQLADTEIFGYQEYGAEYKYQRGENQGYTAQNAISVMFKSMTLTPLYDPSVPPALNYYFVSCYPEFESFCNCLQVLDPTVAPHFILDVHLTGTITHPMPVYNVPGKGQLL